MRFPLRLRVTLAFGVGMAVVLSALGLFLYVRVGHDLMNGIDMELRSRAQVIVDGIAHRTTRLVRAPGHLIDPDEAFAQVLGPGGAILDSSSAVSGAPMLSRRDLGTARTRAGSSTPCTCVVKKAGPPAVPRSRRDNIGAPDTAELESRIAPPGPKNWAKATSGSIKCPGARTSRVIRCAMPSPPT